MTESKFIPKDGQIDYTNIRYCPVINCIVQYDQEILLQQRSLDMRLYPGYWSGVSGFLDTNEDIEEKVYEELEEEVGIARAQVATIEVGQVLVQHAPRYDKTWIIFPVLVTLMEKKQLKNNWEVATTQWTVPQAVQKLKLLPGFDAVLKTFFNI